MNIMNEIENVSPNEFLFDFLDRADSDDISLLGPKLNEFPIASVSSETLTTEMRPSEKKESLFNETAFCTANNDPACGIYSSVSSFNPEKGSLNSSSAACCFDDIQEYTAQLYPSPISSVIDLDNQELIGQIMNVNDIGYNFLDPNFKDENQTETENKELINSIEKMIKSMDKSQEINFIENPELETKRDNNKLNYKKITPKLTMNKFEPIIKPSKTRNLNLNSGEITKNKSATQSQPILVGNFNGSGLNLSNKVHSNYEILSVHTSPTVQAVSLPKAALIISPMLTNSVDKGIPSTNPSQSNNIDSSSLKKQSRMIKNRESACLSRKRKKEYVLNLEDSIKDANEQNKTMELENQELKKKNLVLETENKLLKEQLINKTRMEQLNSTVKLIEQKNFQESDATSSQGRNSLKRPFVMMAVFFVFGLNILQFMNVDEINFKNNIDEYNFKTKFDLIDPQKQQPVKSRHLLSDFDYTDDSNEAKLSNQRNITKNNEKVMDLILINGTWHIVDISICYKLGSMNENTTFYNISHINKLNTELNSWFERHSKVLRRKLSIHDWHESFSSTLWREFKKTKQKKFGSESQASRSLRKKQTLPGRLKTLRDKRKSLKKLTEHTLEFPISLYYTQSKLHENFARRIRANNSSFYYISFKRDYIVIPAIIQSTEKRPKVSIVVPTTFHLKNRVNASSSKKKGKIGFIQIDCEVLHTKSLFFNTDEIPSVYMKILEENEE